MNLLYGLPLLLVSLLITITGKQFPNTPEKRTLAGVYQTERGLFDAKKGKTCRTDHAEGATLHLEKDHENPLFTSETPNRVHLIVAWKTIPKAGQRFQLPDPQIEICYWEKGDLLMFHTFRATGWIEIDQIKAGKVVSGSLELQLIEPHHNFSNSDFHYLGGDFKAKFE
ncbi:MAG: hypothetical protein AAGN35_27140 [Bacteroidota bacterium]